MKTTPKSSARTIVKTLRLTPEQNSALERSAKWEDLKEAGILRRALDIGLPYGSSTPLEKALPEMGRATSRLLAEHLHRKDELSGLMAVGKALAEAGGPACDAAEFVYRASLMLAVIEKETEELKNLMRTLNFVQPLSVNLARCLQSHLRLFAGMRSAGEDRERLNSLADFLQKFGGLCTKK